MAFIRISLSIATVWEVTGVIENEVNSVEIVQFSPCEHKTQIHNLVVKKKHKA